MRKSILLAAMVLFGLTLWPAHAQTLPADEQKFIDQHLSEILTTKTTRLVEADLAKVFSAPIYRIEARLKSGDGESICDTLVTRLDDKLVSVSAPGSNSDLPMFLKMLSPEFKIQNNADATTFQKAIDVIDPPFGGDKKDVKFARNGRTWTFIRGTFFDDKKGYVVQTGADGKVTSIKFTLKIP